MTSQYYDTIQMIERLHRYFLDVVKIELDRKGVEDINNVQAMILYNIGTDTMTVGELTHRGYYLGSNVSYNVKKMSENGYIEQERSVHDKRSIRVKLTEKGVDLYTTLNKMFIRHEQRLDGTKLTDETLGDTVNTLQMVERFWNAQTQFAAMEDD